MSEQHENSFTTISGRKKRRHVSATVYNNGIADSSPHGEPGNSPFGYYAGESYDLMKELLR